MVWEKLWLSCYSRREFHFNFKVKFDWILKALKFKLVRTRNTIDSIVFWTPSASSFFFCFHRFSSYKCSVGRLGWKAISTQTRLCKCSSGRTGESPYAIRFVLRHTKFDFNSLSALCRSASCQKFIWNLFSNSSSYSLVFSKGEPYFLEQCRRKTISSTSLTTVFSKRSVSRRETRAASPTNGLDLGKLWKVF